MGVAQKLIDYRVKSTSKAIDTDGEFIQLYRPQGLIDDGAGGKKRITAPDYTLPSRKRLFTPIATMGRGVTTQPERWNISSLGEKYREFGVLIGEIDDDIQQDDYFFINDNGDKKWIVLFIHDDTRYEIRAECGRERG